VSTLQVLSGSACHQPSCIDILRCPRRSSNIITQFDLNFGRNPTPELLTCCRSSQRGRERKPITRYDCLVIKARFASLSDQQKGTPAAPRRTYRGATPPLLAVPLPPSVAEASGSSQSSAMARVVTHICPVPHGFY